MNPAEVVVCEAQAVRGPQVLPLLRERIGEARQQRTFQALPISDSDSRALCYIETSAVTAPAAFVVRLDPLIHLTDAEFYEFCRLNPDLRIERTAQGDVVIMSLVGDAPAAETQNLSPSW